MKLEFAGSWYDGLRAASAAWAETALPDVSVIGRDEDVAEAASGLEAFWWGEAQKIGEGGPEGVAEDAWRQACRERLVERIERDRA